MNESSAGLQTNAEHTHRLGRSRQMKYAYGPMLTLLVLITGCAVAPPTQEMSEARQSIEAARQSGAGQLAPHALHNADKLLSDAEDNIRQGDYGKAQRDAVAAREAARQARVMSEVRQAQQLDQPPPVPPASSPPPAPEPDDATPAPPPADKQTNGLKPQTYTVAPDDSLWRIAARPEVYGDPHLWPLLLKANAQALQDADLIYPGETLRIERNYSSRDQQAAAQHARQRGTWTLGGMEAADNGYLGRRESR